MMLKNPLLEIEPAATKAVQTFRRKNVERKPVFSNRAAAFVAAPVAAIRTHLCPSRSWVIRSPGVLGLRGSNWAADLPL